MSNDRAANGPKVYANRYRTLKLLGRGNFGQAYLVEDLRAKDKSPTQKVLKRIVVEPEADASLDAVNEAKLMQKLEHPCIVKFYDSFLDGEFFCIVAEYCNNGDLDVCLSKLRQEGNYLEERQVLTWFVQLLCAVNYIHNRGVLHRDLKTRNVFVHDKMLKLGDFGISRILMSTSDMASTFVGTPYYMSPEVLKHDGYNSKSDVWSLGCILVEMCTLQRAFDGSNIMNVMFSIMEKEIPRIPSRYDHQLQDVVDRLLNRNPQRRPSAIEVLQLDYVQQHVKRMSSNRAELSALITESARPVSARSKRDADAIRKEIKSQVSMDQLRQEERTKKLGNLDPRERRRVLKQEEADQRAAQMIAAARENLVKANDSKQKKQMELRGSLTLQQQKDSFDAGYENRDRKQANQVVDQPQRAGVARYHSESDSDRRNGLASEDGMFGPPRTKATPTKKYSLDEERRAPAAMSRTAPVSASSSSRGVYEDRRREPEYNTPLENYQNDEFFYSDSDDDDEGTLRAHDDDEDEAFHKMLENLRQLNMQFSLSNRSKVTSGDRAQTPVVVQTRTEVDAYGPLVRESKIKNMRSQAIEKLGNDAFEKVYAFFKRVRGHDGKSRRLDEATITAELKNLVSPELFSHCFLVDQLIFLQFQSSN